MDRTISEVQRAACPCKPSKVLVARCRQRGTTVPQYVFFICQLNARHRTLETFPLCRRLEVVSRDINN